jgi:hypothetical protein
MGCCGYKFVHRSAHAKRPSLVLPLPASTAAHKQTDETKIVTQPATSRSLATEAQKARQKTTKEK